MSETTTSLTKIEQSKSLLNQHEELGSSYLDSTLPDEAYKLAIEYAQAQMTEVDYDTASTVMRACSMQAKLRLKAGDPLKSNEKYHEALEWCEVALGTTEDQMEQGISLAQKGSFLVRLGEYTAAEDSFDLARSLVGANQTELASISLFEHRLYADRKSPFYSPQRAIELLGSAQKAFEQTGNEKMRKYAERYTLAVLARSKQPLKLAGFLLNNRKSMKEDTGQLLRRAKKGK